MVPRTVFLVYFLSNCQPIITEIVVIRIAILFPGLEDMEERSMSEKKNKGIPCRSNLLTVGTVLRFVYVIE